MFLTTCSVLLSFRSDHTASLSPVERKQNMGLDPVADKEEAALAEASEVKRELDYQTDTSMLSAEWEPFRDIESDIVGYWASVGSTIGGGELLPKHWVGKRRSISYHVAESNTTWEGMRLMQLPTGIRFFTTVTALNGVGGMLSVSSDGVIIDTTAPMMQWVIDGVGTGRGIIDDIDQSVYTDILLGCWKAIDAESELIEYEMAMSSIHPCDRGDLGSWNQANCSDWGAMPVIVDEAEVLNIQKWVAVGENAIYGRFGLELVEDRTYYIGARAVNGAGLRSPPMWSDGVQIKPEGEAMLSETDDVAMMFDVGPMEGSDLDSGTEPRKVKPPNTFGSLLIPAGAGTNADNTSTKIKTSKKPDLPAEMQGEDTKPANNLKFGNYSFSIDASDGETGEEQAGYHFAEPITITIAYNVDLMTAGEMSSPAAAKIPLELVPQLLLWDVVEGRWMYAYETCSPPWHEIDRPSQTYSVHVCHLTLYTLGIQAAPVASLCITCIDEKAMLPEGEDGYRAHQNVSINSTSYDPVITDGVVTYSPIVSFEWALLRAPSDAYDSTEGTNTTGVSMELLDEAGASSLIMIPKAPDDETIAPQAGKAGAIGTSKVRMHGLDHRGVYAFRLTVTDTDRVKTSTVVEVVANFYPNVSAGVETYRDVSNVVSTASPTPISAPAPAPLSRVYAGADAGVLVLLDGSATVDLDFNESLSYEWQLLDSYVPPQIQTAVPVLLDQWRGTMERVDVLLPPATGTYTFELEVTDKAGLRAIDSVTYLVCPNLQTKTGGVNNCPPIAVARSHFVKPAGADEYILLVADETVDLDSSLAALNYEWTQTDGPTRVTIEQASNTSNRPWEGFIARPKSGSGTFKGAGGVQNGGEYLFWTGEEQLFEFELAVFDEWGDTTAHKVTLSTYPPQHNPLKMAALLIFGVVLALAIKFAIIHWCIKKKIRAGKNGWNSEKGLEPDSEIKKPGMLSRISSKDFKHSSRDLRNLSNTEADSDDAGRETGSMDMGLGKVFGFNGIGGPDDEVASNPMHSVQSNPMMSNVRQARLDAHLSSASANLELKERLRAAKEAATKKIRSEKTRGLDVYADMGGSHRGKLGSHGKQHSKKSKHNTKHAFGAVADLKDKPKDVVTDGVHKRMSTTFNNEIVNEDQGGIVEMTDASTGHKYYYNSVTDKTAWTREEVEVKETRLRGWTSFGAGEGTGAGALALSETFSNPMKKTDSFKFDDTSESTSNPMLATMRREGKAETKTKGNAKHTKKAKEYKKETADHGDIEVKIDPTSGNKYYYNTVTQKTAWTREEVTSPDCLGGDTSELAVSGAGAGALVTTEAETEAPKIEAGKDGWHSEKKGKVAKKPPKKNEQQSNKM
jgi:hypothetical protein